MEDKALRKCFGKKYKISLMRYNTTRKTLAHSRLGSYGHQSQKSHLSLLSVICSIRKLNILYIFIFFLMPAQNSDSIPSRKISVLDKIM
jgi:hypothetical protein